MAEETDSRSTSQPRGRSRSRKPKANTNNRTRKKRDDGDPDNPSDDTDNNDPSRAYPNYNYSPDRRFLAFLLLLVELLAVAFLLAVIFFPPYTAGGSLSILRDTQGGEYVGVLRKCSAKSCDPWMGGTTSASGSGGTDTGTATDTAASKRDSNTLNMLSRADDSTASSSSSSSIDYPNMFLTTGLATLAALWIVFYTFIFTLTRLIFLYLPPDDSNPSSGSKDMVKRSIYRIPRAFLFVSSVLLPAVSLDCIIKGVKYRSEKNLSGTEGIGGGIALILISGICVILAALIELRTPGGTTHKILLKLGCGTNCGILSGWTNDNVRSRADRIGMSEKGRRGRGE